VSTSSHYCIMRRTGKETGEIENELYNSHFLHKKRDDEQID
jgi:hypothetical protein